MLDPPERWRNREMFASSNGALTFAGAREGMLRVAQWLKSVAMVQAGDRIAICLPKSLESVQVIYGIHAVGAAYIPLPCQGPERRLRAIMHALKPSLLVATSQLATALWQKGESDDLPPIRILDPAADGRALESLLRGIPAASTIPQMGGRDLAAIMFTSGSMGEPKGVMRAHDSVPASDWLWSGQINENDRFVSTTALHYTTSHDIFMPAARGCSVYLASEREVMFPDHVAGLLAREKATMWLTAPTLLRQLVEEGRLKKHDLGNLRRVGLAGEPLPVPLLRQAMAEIPQAEFINIYGATEAPTMIQFAAPRPLPETVTTVPLGKPSRNYDVKLCNERGDEVGPGETGEICVTDGPVMLGYWGDPELTAAKRLPGRPNSYRTGDLARMGSDGLFHLVGRADDVIKLRGQRIALGEVEAALASHPGISEAAAYAVQGPAFDIEIHAVTVARKGFDRVPDLRRHCADLLPAVARPAKFIFVDSLPRLSSGKVDREALKQLGSES